jgi:YVTN family beta-propeller protein
VTGPITVGNGPSSVAFSPNGKKAYVANYGAGTVSVINVSTGTVSRRIRVGFSPVSVAFSPNGKKAYVANAGDVTVSVIKTR